MTECTIEIESSKSGALAFNWYIKKHYVETWSYTWANKAMILLFLEGRRMEWVEEETSDWFSTFKITLDEKETELFRLVSYIGARWSLWKQLYELRREGASIDELIIWLRVELIKRAKKS